MKKFDISLLQLRKTRFPELYEKLLLGQELDEEEKTGLLQLAVLFINADSEHVRKLGYRIVLFYSNLSGDFLPLYDLALNKGLIPVAKFIEDKHPLGTQRASFFQSFQSSYTETFRQDGIYLTEQQSDLVEQTRTDASEGSAAIIAPTSYGKSELILEALSSGARNICILVPTKALIAQTKRRVINSAHFKEDRVLITHSEMYKARRGGKLVAILTQERLLRLLIAEPALKFDLVFVDEAHNLLENESRSRLLASAIILLRKKNPAARFRFMTPFLLDYQNLSVRYVDLPLAPLRISEYLKSERIYCCDLTSGEPAALELYDQFMDVFIPTGEADFAGDVPLVLAKMKHKNIVYLNKPPHVERFARRLANSFEKTDSAVIDKACKALAEFVHKDYFLIGCLQKGIAYHHGSVPDVVKLYVESLFTKAPDIQFIATTSTLLEGINIPAECLFILDYKKGRQRLAPAQFKNLIGRVCRLKEIFHPETGHLSLLEPNIYVIASRYISQSANIKNFIRESMKMDRREVEDPENVLLAKAAVTEETADAKKGAEQFLENIVPGIINDEDVRHANTEFGRACLRNSIDEINVFSEEASCQAVIARIVFGERLISNAKSALELIDELFLSRSENDNLRRLREGPSRAFYTMLFDWRIENVSFAEMIADFLRYWEKREKIDPLVFVSHKWGEETRDGGHLKMWVDISTKTSAQRVNLTIVRIKEEQDFLDNTLMKFVEVLHELGVLESAFYDQIKYGTKDAVKIELIKNGFSSALAGLLLKKYRKYLHFDAAANQIGFDPELRGEMVRNEENEIMIFELDCNVKNIEGA